MRRTAGLVAGVLAVVLLLTGTGVTLAAWTTDEVTVEGETFTAGDLDVTIVPVDVPTDPVARPGEPYVAKYKAIVTKTGDNLRELSCDVIAEDFHGTFLDGPYQIGNSRVVVVGEEFEADFSYDPWGGVFFDSECALSFGESDTLEVPVEFRVDSDLGDCMDPAPTVGGGVALQVSQSRAGIDMPWSAQASVGLPEVTFDIARDEVLFDVTLESHDASTSANMLRLANALRAVRPDLTSAGAQNLLDLVPLVVVPRVDAATAESAKATIEGVGVGAVVSFGPSAWQSIRDEPYGDLSDVILWPSAYTTTLRNAVRDLAGIDQAVARTFIESAPGVLFSSVDTATAENAKAVIEAAGGVVKFMPPGGAACW